MVYPFYMLKDFEITSLDSFFYYEITRVYTYRIGKKKKKVSREII